MSLSDFEQIVCTDNADAEDGCFAQKDLPLPDFSAGLNELAEAEGGE